MSSITGAPTTTSGGGSSSEVIYTEVPNYISIRAGSSIRVETGGAIGIKLNSFGNSQGMVVDNNSIITIKGV